MMMLSLVFAFAFELFQNRNNGPYDYNERYVWAQRTTWASNQEAAQLGIQAGKIKLYFHKQKEIQKPLKHFV